MVDQSTEDELRAWVAALWMALADVTRAYREYAWSCAQARPRPEVRPRRSDPVYEHATKTLWAVPYELVSGLAVSDEAESIVNERVERAPLRHFTPLTDER